LPPNCRFPAANVFDGPGFGICGSKRHHNVNMTEKHLGFASLRSPFGNREPRTMGNGSRPLFAYAGPVTKPHLQMTKQPDDFLDDFLGQGQRP
jgi:hypothetical protein